MPQSDANEAPPRRCLSLFAHVFSPSWLAAMGLRLLGRGGQCGWPWRLTSAPRECNRQVWREAVPWERLY